MRNLLALVGAATITFVGLGWYMGWYHVSRQPSITGTQRFNLEVSPNKIAADSKVLIDKVGEVATQIADETGKNEAPATGTDGAKTGAPAALPGNQRTTAAPTPTH
jgi:hypothetical protein